MLLKRVPLHYLASMTLPCAYLTKKMFCPVNKKMFCPVNKKYGFVFSRE